MREQTSMIQTLIEQFKQGDERAFETLYTTLYSPLYRFIYLRTGNKEEAEDLTQTLFLKVYRTLPAYEDRGLQPEAYFFQAARNMLIDHYRKKSHAPITSDSLIENHAETNGNDEQNIKRENREIIAIGMTILSDEQKKIVEDRHLFEKEYETIAKELGKTEEAIRQIQSRALKKMRIYLKEKNII